jgi:hypothetical protein
MSVRVQHGTEPTLWFITFTWFDYLKEKYEIKTTAFVIMPNHIHIILFFPSDQYDLNKLISNGKRFIAYEMIKRLKQQKENSILNQLTEGLTVKEKIKDKSIKCLKKVLMRKLLRPRNSFIRNCSICI